MRPTVQYVRVNSEASRGSSQDSRLDTDWSNQHSLQKIQIRREHARSENAKLGGLMYSAG